MEQYIVTGMSCAACSTRVEKAVSKVPGVTSCSVSLLTNSMGVEGQADADAIIAAVTNAGYGAEKKGGAGRADSMGSAAAEELLKDHETPKMKKRLIASVCLLIPMMYVSMGHMMWNWPLPEILAKNHVAQGIIQLVCDGCDGGEPKVFHQRVSEHDSRGAEHGCPGGARSGGILCVQHLRFICHDRCTDADGHGRGDGVHA